MLIVAAILGACVGSFITLASYRLPRGEDIVRLPSRCPSCGTKLEARDLFPLLSWLAHKARCRHCAAPVSARYPLVELATAVIFAGLYAGFGATVPFLVLALFATCLLILIVTDLEQFIIPDSVQVALVPLALAWGWVQGAQWSVPLIGGAAGLGIGLLLHHGYRWVRGREGLGFGDVKFLGVAGLWIGALNLVPFLFYSGLLGIATAGIWRLMGKEGVFPFGPALAASLFLCVVWPQVPEFFWIFPLLLHR